jgi:hypothetical protein
MRTTKIFSRIVFLQLFLAFASVSSEASASPACPATASSDSWNNCDGVAGFNDGMLSGHWVNGKVQGFGKFWGKNGSYYEGQFKDTKFDGKGIQLQTDYIDYNNGTNPVFFGKGVKWLGTFVNGQKQGAGIGVYPDDNFQYNPGKPTDEFMAKATYVNNNVVSKLSKGVRVEFVCGTSQSIPPKYLNMIFYRNDVIIDKQPVNQSVSIDVGALGGAENAEYEVIDRRSGKIPRGKGRQCEATGKVVQPDFDTLRFLQSEVIVFKIKGKKYWTGIPYGDFEKMN